MESTSTIRCYYCAMVGTSSGLEPPDDNGFVYSGAVVWVLHDQTHVTVPQAVHHIRSTALLQDEEVAVLCSIPDSAPYWVSPKDASECNLVQLDNTVSVWVASMDRVCAYRCITYYLESTMRTFVTLNRGISSQDDIKADELAFYYVEPHGAMWPGEIYVITNNNGDLVPALNIVPLQTTDDPLPPAPPSPPQPQYPPPNLDLKQDVIQMMGPAVGQLEHHVIDGSPNMEEQPATNAPRTPENAPPLPPDAPPQCIVVKKEPAEELPDPSADDPNISTGLTLAQPNTEEDVASDMTFNESIDSGAQ